MRKVRINDDEWKITRYGHEFSKHESQKEYRKILADQTSQKFKLLYRFVNEMLKYYHTELFSIHHH